MVTLQVTTGFVSEREGVARVTMWMLLLRGDKGRVLCSELGGLFVRLVHGEGKLAPTLHFQICITCMFTLLIDLYLAFSFSLLVFILLTFDGAV